MMLNPIDALADAIWHGFENANNACVDRGMDIIDTGGSYEAFSMEEVAAVALERFYENCIIKTVEELKAIPTSPELLCGALIKCPGYLSFGDVYELCDDGTWDRLGNDPERLKPEDVPLPAVLLYLPPERG